MKALKMLSAARVTALAKLHREARGSQRTHYPLEFKMQVLSEAEDSRVVEVAKRYGLHPSVIYHWRKGHMRAGSITSTVGVVEAMASRTGKVRMTTTLVDARRISPLAQLKADLAESNGETLALRERCRQLEWLVGKMVSTHPDLAKFISQQGAKR